MTTAANNKEANPSLVQTVSDALINDILKERKAERRWKMVRRLLYVATMVLGLVYYVGFVLFNLGHKFVPDSEMVAVVHISGEISAKGLASADKVIPALKNAFERKNVKAIALAIDSPGGAPVEAERIYQAIEALKIKNPKPVYAFINNLGASAAYMIAVHADRVYAANYSLVGSIGAVMSGWDFHKALEKFDVSQKVYASGKLKALMNPYIASTPEGDAKALALVTNMGEQFRSDVLRARSKQLAGNTIDLGTGEVWTGEQAVKIGLVDEIGTIDQVVASVFAVRSFDFGPSHSGFPMLSMSIDSAFEAMGRGVVAGLKQSQLDVR
jgi:protease IV